VRVERCFGFVDLCGFTSFAERNGDDRVVVVLADMRTSLREMAARRGVRIVKWLGDGAMLSSTMVDAVIGTTIELAAHMEQHPSGLPVRAGLAAGPVVMFEGDDYIGAAVNVAARLCAQAAPHQVLATVDVAEQRPAWVAAEEATSVPIRGLREEVSTRVLHIQRTAGESCVDPVCGLRIPVAHSVRGAGSERHCSEACAAAALEREHLADSG
jgi:adenylate cyclase